MSKIRHTDDEKRECVNEYLNGKNKYYLAGKYSTSIRSIDRWIAKMDINEVELRKRKRADCIDIDIQEEIIENLNTNPIIKGFKISQWNEAIIIKYKKEDDIKEVLRTIDNIYKVKSIYDIPEKKDTVEKNNENGDIENGKE